MQNHSLWKYCTTRQWLDMLLSFRLLGSGWTDEKVIACLYTVSNHVEKHYREVSIPKRDGSLRRLLVPDPMLMRIQKNILHRILNGMEISRFATAYHKGAGILSNALPHVGKARILKLDLKDFFGSIQFNMVYQRAFSGLYYPPQVGVLLTSLCCYREYLPQGGPTSAALSNLIMRSFDDYMGQWCEEREIAYTRYCDDMTFSGDFDEGPVRRKVSAYLEVMGFQLNHKKTRVQSEHVRQSVTGIVVNSRPQVSRTYRRELRQEIYYCTRYGVLSHLKRSRGVEYPDLVQRCVNSASYSTGGKSRHSIMRNLRNAVPGDEAVRKYLNSLLGKVNFVLQINPEDQQFVQAKRSVLAMINDLGDH